MYDQRNQAAGSRPSVTVITSGAGFSTATVSSSLSHRGPRMDGRGTVTSWYRRPGPPTACVWRPGNAQTLIPGVCGLFEEDHFWQSAVW